MMRSNKIRIMLIIYIILVSVSIAASFIYLKYIRAEDKIATVELSEQQTLDGVADRITLPVNQSALITKVKESNINNYKYCFNDTKLNDVAIYYTQVKKAFLYRPSTRRIVDVSKVRTDNHVVVVCQESNIL